MQHEVWRTVSSGNHYTPRSLVDEGFIHCSTFNNVLIPANERFAGHQDLILLVIEIERLSSKVIYEDCEDRGLLFPHIYGELNTSAVQAAIPFPPSASGLFELPAGLNRWKVLNKGEGIATS